MLNWFSENKEWVFSGIGISAIALLLAAFKWGFIKQPNYPITQNPGKTIQIGEGAVISGQIIGGDLRSDQTEPKIEQSAQLERYRGNVSGKIKVLFRRIDQSIKNLENKPKYPITMGAPSVTDQILYLKEFRQKVESVEFRFNESLDKGDLVTAHEVLNELREEAIEHVKLLKEHRELYERSTVMCISTGEFHGAMIDLEETILYALKSFYE